MEYSFNTAYSQIRDIYGIELDQNDFENIGIIAWDKIGNKRYRLYHFHDHGHKDNEHRHYVDLPCNCDIIEAVTTNYEDYQKTSDMNLPGNMPNGWIEGYIESRKFNTNELYAPGKFIKYIRDGNRLFFNSEFHAVHILYKGVLSDEDGLPSLNEKELDAVSCFCAYTDTFKRALVTRDSATLQLSQILEQQWLRKCNQARVPAYINQNEMDEILNAASSWDRKRFGRSFKPVR